MEVPSSGKPCLSPEEKSQLIKQLEDEVQKRSNKLVLSTGQLCTSLLFLGELEINKVPKNVRALSIKEFLSIKATSNPSLSQTSKEVSEPSIEQVKIPTTKSKRKISVGKKASTGEDAEPLRRSKRNRKPVENGTNQTTKTTPPKGVAKPILSVPLGSGDVLELDPSQSPTALRNLNSDAKKQLAERLAALQSQLNRFMSVIN